MIRWLLLALALTACEDECTERNNFCSLLVVDARSVGIDAPAPGPMPAHPAQQQGCMTGQKATWVVIEELPAQRGAIRCVPDGTGALGGTCTRGPAGEATGYDDCSAGLVCSESSCRDICVIGGTGVTGCAVGTCAADPLLFSNGGDEPVLGVCRVR